ncbi:MGH1-like glycoside hydrolase domain-containing protein [Capnocytophaga canimorsus]|uniref:MGH1-like glycoside hydrolase domain-containing protein n=1 Tax=Capnocytophaga canimorsus TaxID=28188 RepID=UPI0037D7C0E7
MDNFSTFESSEKQRIEEKNKREKQWLNWGPYLSERQWGTVREDYSANGDAWNYLSHDDARSRTYRWGEDGLAGISDRLCNICLSVALWNGKDPILKERLYGLSNNQGNHGEDVKELYYYLDNTPTHAYMKYLYKYPQNEFPYQLLEQTNAERGLHDPEFELIEAGIFDQNAYFDIQIEYAKASENDIFMKITATNQGDETAPLTLLPTLLLRNYWSFIEIDKKPEIILESDNQNHFVRIEHESLGTYYLYFDRALHHLFTENETNDEKIHCHPNDHPFKKDLFHTAVISGDISLPTQRKHGTKFAPMYQFDIEAKSSKTIFLRLSNQKQNQPFIHCENLFLQRAKECDNFYRDILKPKSEELFYIQKQALSGLLWSKQYYYFDVEKWLEGDPKQPQPPKQRWQGRNAHWQTLRNHDILLMPDKWEYPWYASWDSAFHCVSMAMIDSQFAKEQLLLFTKEWYMKPNGQIPAYEWNFSDVNPPVQPWATVMIYLIDKKQTGKADIAFLKRMFNKLTVNFTWWVNRLDRTENNVFEGGFLGLDNIGIFDRSQGIPGVKVLEQVDGTAWMALYCLSMLKISLEISKEDESYEEMATKYFGHFIHIAKALNHMNEENKGIWDENDGFFYDKIIFHDGNSKLVKVRSVVGMLALIAVLYIDKETLDRLPRFKNSFSWFKKHRMNKLKHPIIQTQASDDGILLSLVPKNRIAKLIRTLINEKEFLSDYGIRSLSKVYENPFSVPLEGNNYQIAYDPAESTSHLFGGNSNWRGPIWFPINYILIDALRELSHFYDDTKFEFPTGNSQNQLNFKEISNEISKRLIRIFEKDKQENRPVNLLYQDLYQREAFKHLILFYEYFHGDNGRGVGASHQTGWTALVANLIEELYN